MTSHIALAAVDAQVRNGLLPILNWCANAAGTASAIVAGASVTLRAGESAFVIVTARGKVSVAEVRVYRRRR